jgi:subtilisin family serine protease
MYHTLTRYTWLLVGLLIMSALFLWAGNNVQAQDNLLINEPELNQDTPENEMKVPEAIDWNSWDVIPGRVLIKYTLAKGAELRSQVNASNVDGLRIQPLESWAEEAFVAQRGSAAGFQSILPNHFIGEFEPGERDRILALLQADPNVIYVEPDRRHITALTWDTDTPDDTSLDDLWGMTRIGAPTAWKDLSATRSGVRVAVMENRFEATHPDLSAQVASVINNPRAINDHATHVAGTIAATGNNRRGVVGVANVELVSLSWGDATTTFVNYIAWANSNGVRIINMSFKRCGDEACTPCLYTTPSATEQEAINSSAILFVAAASNYGCNLDESGRLPLPAGYNNVIGVSALNQNDTLASFSNFGAYVDLTAPGVNILSTGTGGSYYWDSGTSMASPHVAGTAAAVLSIQSTFSRASLTRLLSLTAQDIGAAGRDDSFGAGVVRVDRAVDAIANVYADASFNGRPCPLRTGSLAYPYCNLNDAIDVAPVGGTVGLVRDNTFYGTFNLTKPMTLKAVGGVVTIGSTVVSFTSQSDDAVSAEHPTPSEQTEAPVRQLFLPLIAFHGQND